MSAEWTLVWANHYWRIKLGDTGIILDLHFHEPGAYRVWFGTGEAATNTVKAASPEDAQRLALSWAATELERAAGTARGAL